MLKIDKNNLLLSTILVLSAIFILLPIFSMHIDVFLDPLTLHEESRSRYIYYPFQDPELFKGDYITQYMQKQYRVHENKITNIYNIFVKFGIEHIQLRLLLKILILISVFSTIIFSTVASYRLGGVYLAYCSAIFTSFMALINYQITAPIPHMFAFPLLSGFICSLIYGRVLLMGLIVILSSLIYLPVTLISGITLAIYLLFMPEQSRGCAKDWSFVKRFSYLAILGTITLYSLYSYKSYNITGYGDYIAPFTDKYVETGTGGRHFTGSTNPIFHSFNQFSQSFKEGGPLIFIFVIYIIVSSLRQKIYFKWQESTIDKENYHRIIGYLIGVTALFIAIFIYDATSSYRILLYGLGIFLPLVLPTCFMICIKQYTNDTKLEKYKYAPIYCTLFLFIAMALISEKDNHDKFGYIKSPKSHEVIYEFANKTPKNTVFAGMPSYFVDYPNIIDYIPLISKRPAMLHLKGYQVFHEDYLLNMRDRMNAIINAYYNTDIDSIMLLKNKYNVRYFIVNTDYYKEALPFFVPFGEKMKEAAQIAKTRKPFVLNNLDKAIIQSENLYLFDLQELQM